MSKVRKWDGEGTFAGSRGNDGVATVSAVRSAEIERQGSTPCGHSHWIDAPADPLDCLTTVSGSNSFEQAATRSPFHILCRA